MHEKVRKWSCQVGWAEVLWRSYQEKSSSKLKRGGKRRLQWEERCLFWQSLCEGKFTGVATLIIKLQVEFRISLHSLWFCWECIGCVYWLQCIGHLAHHCCKPSAWTWLSCWSPALGLSWKGERSNLSLSSTFGWTAKKSKQNWRQTQRSFAEVCECILAGPNSFKDRTSDPLEAILVIFGLTAGPPWGYFSHLWS